MCDIVTGPRASRLRAVRVLLSVTGLSPTTMGYLQPPHLSTKEHPSYAQGYAQILSAHRRSPLTSASSVIILVARDFDALCAARMLAELFRQDDVTYRIIPMAGVEDGLKKAADIKHYKEVCLRRKNTTPASVNTSLMNSCIPSSSSISAQVWSWVQKGGLERSGITYGYTS